MGSLLGAGFVSGQELWQYFGALEYRGFSVYLRHV